MGPVYQAQVYSLTNALAVVYFANATNAAAGQDDAQTTPPSALRPPGDFLGPAEF